MSELAFHPDFQPYLSAIRNEYGRWREDYTETDAQGRERRKVPERKGQPEASPFDFGLMVQTVPKDDARRTPNLDNSEEPPKEPQEKIERLPVLKGLRKYAFDEKTGHLLLVGRPGSGKSTALARLLLEEADRFSAGTADTIPVLVELRYWKKSIEDLMLEAFRCNGLELNAAQLDRLLNENRLLVLMDGMNELPSEEGRSQLTAFRRKYPRVPAIFTTRDLSLGGDAGVEKKLEMQPLTEPQMREFVEAYLPEDGEAMWRQLQGRLREFGETPLLLWMLCEMSQLFPNAQLPTNLAGIFQVFTRAYEESSVRKHEVAPLKGDTKPLSDRRLWCKALKHLAWVMMHAKQFIPQLVIHHSAAERELERLFQKEPHSSKTARDCLEDLLKYHLLQIRTGDEIEFRHQLIQEYYAAEALRERLPELSDGELKRDYLNYLKWTEPVALMLALVEDEALRVVRLALEVDWMLGARLAGEVKREFQEETVEMVSGLDVPLWLKVELWEKTRSDFAIPGLLAALENENSDVRRSAAEALGNLGSEAAIPGWLAALENENSDVRRSAAEALGKLGSDAAIPVLLQALKDRDSSERGTVAKALENMISEDKIGQCLWALTDPDYEKLYDDDDFYIYGNGNQGLCTVIKNLFEEVWGEIEYEEYSKNEEYFSIVFFVAELLEKLCLEEEGEYSALLLDFEEKYLYWSVQDVLENLRALQERKDEDSSSDVCRDVTEILENPASQRTIPGVLRPFDEKDFWIPKSAIEALGNLSSEVAIPDLLQALEDENFYVRGNAAKVLGNIKDDRAAHILPHLLTLIPTESGEEAFRALTAIQTNCKFYNYDIFSSPAIPKPKAENPSGDTTNIYNIDTFNAPNSALNLGGTIGGNQTSTQNPKP